MGEGNLGEICPSSVFISGLVLVEINTSLLEVRCIEVWSWLGGEGAECRGQARNQPGITHFIHTLTNINTIIQTAEKSKSYREWTHFVDLFI